MAQKGVSTIVIILIIVGVLVVAGGVWYWQSQKEKSEKPKPPTSTITVLSPNGGEIWKTGTKQTIRWSTQGIPSTYKISVHIRRIPPPPLPETGQEFDPIVFTGLQNDGSEDWIISDMYPEGKYIIEMTAYSKVPLEPGNYVSDESDVQFSIVKPISKPVDWENLVPTIQTVIGPTFLGVLVGERPMSIWQTSDITGDGVPEALVYLGQGGAYTGFLTLMRIENDKPVVAQFKQKDGKISPLMFLDGASVMNGESATMLPEKNAIYAGHWSRAVSGEPYGGLSNCKVETYQWNSQTKIFDFSQSLSNEIRPGYCQKADI